MSDEVKKTLLIADDEQDIREIFSLIYESDFNILTAASGNEAFELYKNNDVDIILSDLKMPDGDGAFFAESVLNYIEKKPCPFFIMTANLEYNYHELNKRGVKLVMSKPFDFDQFLNIAKFFLETLHNDPNTRTTPRVKCDLSLMLKEIENDYIKILDISSEGFLLQLHDTPPLKAGDEISFSSMQLQSDQSSVVEGKAQCRWVIKHGEFTLAGFAIISISNRNKLLEFVNRNVLEGNFH